MIAIGVLAALGQAIHGLLVLAVIGALAVVAIVGLLAFLGALFWDREPGRLEKVLRDRCFLCGAEEDLEPVQPGAVTVACRNWKACDERRERAAARGAG